MSPAPNVSQQVFAQLLELLKEPRTVDELCEKMNVAKRTIYRYLTRLSDAGVDVRGTLARPTKYSVP